jgi:hypothetical protein
MAAKKNNQKPASPTYKGKTVNWDKPGTRKPTEAITQKGQKATGLSKSTVAGNRFTSTAKGTGSENIAGTFVKKAAETVGKGTVALSGAGSVAKAAMNPTKKNIASAALAVTPLPIGKIGSFAAKNSYALGKTVVHGSPVQGLKKIVPNTGSIARPAEKVNFSWSTKSKYSGTLGNNASNYAKGGSIYVGKVPRGSVVKEPNKAIVVSKAPIKVKKEISATAKNLDNKIDKAIPGSKVRDVKKSVAEKKKDIKAKKDKKTSVV